MTHRERNATNQKRGSGGQRMVRDYLDFLRVQMVTPIATPHVRVGGGAGLCHIRYTERVPGDFFACSRTGRLVLVEVKTTKAASLSVTSFEMGQIDTLDAFTDSGALVLIGWARIGLGVRLLPWLLCRPAHGAPLKWDSEIVLGQHITDARAALLDLVSP